MEEQAIEGSVSVQFQRRPHTWTAGTLRSRSSAIV
jgi:hypothetical protein